MPRGRPIEPVVLTDDEKDQLLSLANSRSLPHGVVRRAQMAFSPAPRARRERLDTARRMRLSDATVGKWPYRSVRSVMARDQSSRQPVWPIVEQQHPSRLRPARWRNRHMAAVQTFLSVIIPEIVGYLGAVHPNHGVSPMLLVGTPSNPSLPTWTSPSSTSSTC